MRTFFETYLDEAYYDYVMQTYDPLCLDIPYLSWTMWRHYGISIHVSDLQVEVDIVHAGALFGDRKISEKEPLGNLVFDGD